MSEFWGFAFAPYLAMIVIPVLSFTCLYHARTFVTKI